jgi:hypothetical protein
LYLCEDRYAIGCSKAGVISWFWPSPDFHHWIKRGKKLKASTYAVDFFEKGVPTVQTQEIQEVTRFFKLAVREDADFALAYAKYGPNSTRARADG